MLVSYIISIPAFEAVSAMGTVGLSMGATPYLDTFGKLVIIATMYIGRVMPAMIIYYLNSKITEFDVNYPKAKILNHSKEKFRIILIFIQIIIMKILIILN